MLRCRRISGQFMSRYGRRWGSTKSEKPSELEEQYQRKSQREHILLRSEVYIGSLVKDKRELYVFDEKKKAIRPKVIQYIPGLYKIYDEILVNASDNYERSKDSRLKHDKMTYIKTWLNQEKTDSSGKSSQGWITIENDGIALPIEYHRQENMYIPELLFGSLLTSSNFDDSLARYTGGRHGYGAKLTNIFSKEFQVEVCDVQRGRHFSQSFSENMSQRNDPIIKELTSKQNKNYTRISFLPDYSRFRLKSNKLETDLLSLLKRRTYDVAACCPDLKVYLNDSLLPIDSFEDYVKLHTVQSNSTNIELVRCDVNSNLSLYVRPSPTGDFSQISFCNGISTLRGGTHVDILVQQIAKHVAQKVEKKTKDSKVPLHRVKDQLQIFVNARIPNPSFDSQTKETLRTSPTEFNFSTDLSTAMLNRISSQTHLIESVLESVQAREKAALVRAMQRKVSSRRVAVPKLEDANRAGTSDSSKCTLIITEGDSAKSLAVAGLSVIGRDYYGVFPLKGKMLNAREASPRQLQHNEEITNIMLALGLSFQKTYETKQEVESLRYGSVMLMCDQDTDGSHIKGLFLNLFHAFWPFLLKRDKFAQEFVTPIVKVWTSSEHHQFFTLPEYKSFVDSLPKAQLPTVKKKYYKGLGTSTSKEAKEYFSDLNKHRIRFHWDGDKVDHDFRLAFDKNYTQERKEWLSRVTDQTFVDHSNKLLGYSEFINNELILFSQADNIRSIPSLVDGLKPGQRKVLYGCFKRNLKESIKVAQLAGYVAEHSAYFHGEVSLHGTILNMAQDFVGSNNLPFLVPEGQFGTRHMGGKDAASSRYIYTKLHPLTRLVFRPEDDALLQYNDEDGFAVEPIYYIPVFPVVLCNGVAGVGTGFNTSLPAYHPLDIIANVKRNIQGETMQPMVPWYRDFDGVIDTRENERNVIVTRGKVTKLDNTKIVIDELPIKKWTFAYKKTLEQMREEKKIKDYSEYHTDAKVRFEVRLTSGMIEQAKDQGFIDYFNLESTLKLNNMNLFDAQGKLQNYGTAQEIIEQFCRVREDLYEKRKKRDIEETRENLKILKNKKAFVEAVSNRKLDLQVKETEILSGLHSLNLEKLRNSIEPDSDDIKHYDYLLSLPIKSLTKSQVDKLRAQVETTETHLNHLLNITPIQIWLKELDEIDRYLRTKLEGFQ